MTLAVLLRRRRMLDEVALAATDISEDALQLARENAVAHAVGDRITFDAADLLPGADTEPLGPRAREPAVRAHRRDPGPADRPPRSSRARALDGGADGLRVIDRLLDQLPGRARATTASRCSRSAATRAEAMRDLVAERLPGWACDIELDLGRPAARGDPAARRSAARPGAPAPPCMAGASPDGPDGRARGRSRARGGGVVALPTDTVYGIARRPRDARAASSGCSRRSRGRRTRRSRCCSPMPSRPPRSASSRPRPSVLARRVLAGRPHAGRAPPDGPAAARRAHRRRARARRDPDGRPARPRPRRAAGPRARARAAADDLGEPSPASPRRATPTRSRRCSAQRST